MRFTTSVLLALLAVVQTTTVTIKLNEPVANCVVGNSQYKVGKSSHEIVDREMRVIVRLSYHLLLDTRLVIVAWLLLAYLALSLRSTMYTVSGFLVR